jgi:L-threonylcarbamoyladenylate synthase
LPRSRKREKNSPPQAGSLTEAIDALAAGELVVYPTETFYGIGADALSPAALGRLFAAKQRESGKPVALIAADGPMAFSLARRTPALAQRLADSFWPGALTLVIAARDGLPPELLGAGGGVGVRVSSHPTARALSAGLGRPITATSANRAGEPAARTLDEARAALGTKVKVYLEGGRLDVSAPSTVVAVAEDDWKVLREGSISRSQLAAALAGEMLE